MCSGGKPSVGLVQLHSRYGSHGVLNPVVLHDLVSTW